MIFSFKFPSTFKKKKKKKKIIIYLGSIVFQVKILRKEIEKVDIFSKLLVCSVLISLLCFLFFH